MPNKAIFRIRRPSVWSEYTSYSSVAGLHSETSHRSLARKNNFDKQCINDLTVIEGAHKKDMKNFDKSKREMEQSMLAYSEKMREINRQRNSLPILPSLQPAKFWPVGNDREISRSVSSEKMMMLEEDNISVKNSAETKESCRKLTPIIFRSNNRKMTYHGSEGHLLGANAVIRPRHSVSISDPSKQSEEKRRRKTGITSPPSPESFRKLHSNCNSADSGIGSQNFLGEDFDSDKSSVESESQARTSVHISPFPDIMEVTLENPMKKNSERKNSDKIFLKEKRHRDIRKMVRKSVGDLPESRPNNKLLPLRHSPINSPRKMSNAGSVKKNSLLIDLKKAEEKKGPGACQCFCYSEAMKELLKSPNPFSLSKTNTVSKLEKGPDGRMIATMSAAVLTVIDIDDMQNVRGIKLNLKRHSEPDSVKNGSPNDIGASSTDKIDLEKRGSVENGINIEDTLTSGEHKDIDDTYLDGLINSQMPNLANQSNSTLTMVSVEG